MTHAPSATRVRSAGPASSVSRRPRPREASVIRETVRSLPPTASVTGETSSSSSAKGHRIAVPAVVALLAGAVATAGWNRRWGFADGCVAAAAAAVVVVVLTLVLPGAED